MDKDLIGSISQEIYRRFPEISGIQPRVQVQSQPSARSIHKTPTYVLTFQKQVQLPTRHAMARLVRVVVSEQGKILKISTSR